MNFIDVTVAADADSFRLTGDGVDITLPQRRFPALGAHAGRSVTVGRAAAASAPRASNGNGEQVGFGGAADGDASSSATSRCSRCASAAADIRVAGVDPELALATGTRVDVTAADRKPAPLRRALGRRHPLGGNTRAGPRQN